MRALLHRTTVYEYIYLPPFPVARLHHRPMGCLVSSIVVVVRRNMLSAQSFSSLEMKWSECGGQKHRTAWLIYIGDCRKVIRKSEERT